MIIKTIAVMGAGSWGSTLAALLSKKGYQIKLWEYDKKNAESLTKKRKLKTLPQLKIPREIIITSKIKDIVDADIFIIAVPSFAFRNTLKLLKHQIKNKKIYLIIATKGFEIKSGKTLSRVALEEFPRAKIAILTGPSHAEEVSIEMPTAITIASTDTKFSKELQKIFSTPKLRVYTNTDIRGCEIGGALKNIYAIAGGICDGLGLGDNAKAALITRSLNEMTCLGTQLGGRFETFMGLSGLGDLIVTCYSKHSRNRRLGEMLGRGIKLKEALKKMTMVAEGIYATKSIIGIKTKLDLPIIKEVYKVLFQNKSPQKSISTLMSRPLKTE